MRLKYSYHMENENESEKGVIVQPIENCLTRLI